MAFIGPLWMPVTDDAITCERCQHETEEIGDCGYCHDCCAAQCTHMNCDCSAGEEPQA
jgi:hypothetical protein